MPLKVLIIGAGLGGLGTAIALTRAGHDVEVRLKNLLIEWLSSGHEIDPKGEDRSLKSQDLQTKSVRPYTLHPTQVEF